MFDSSYSFEETDVRSYDLTQMSDLKSARLATVHRTTIEKVPRPTRPTREVGACTSIMESIDLSFAPIDSPEQVQWDKPACAIKVIFPRPPVTLVQLCFLLVDTTSDCF